MKMSIRKLSSVTTMKLADGIIHGRRDCLAKAITLVESTRLDHKNEANVLLQKISDHNFISSSKGDTNLYNNGKTLRLGIAGPPGAGKSTFIDNIGMRLIANQHKVAVIPVDPSSHISGGSILGDKTRMDNLSRSDDAYVRASPTRGVLGGIAEHTSDVIKLCEAAGYDVVIVESVGLGQSEVDIDNAVDMLLVIVPPGGGDGLQASKKGIMEVADLVVVNKADGSLESAAKHTKADYSGSMQFIRQKHNDWRAPVLMMSARTGAGIDEVVDTINKFHEVMVSNGGLVKKRSTQLLHWMRGQLRRQIIEHLEKDPVISVEMKKFSSDVVVGKLTPRLAASRIMNTYFNEMK